MNKYQLVKKIFEENQDETKAISMAKYMKNNFAFYGIQTPLRKDIYHMIIEEDRVRRIIDWDFLDMCYEDEHREFQYLVYDYLRAMQKYLTFDDIKRIEKYVRTKEWWDTIDFLNRIIGDIGLKDKRVDELMLNWSIDDDMWVRRLAIEHQLMRKEKTNQELLRKIIENNLNSNEFFINKAIGWSLRDYSKTNPQWVTKFIETHKDNMSSLSLKEARKYL